MRKRLEVLFSALVAALVGIALTSCAGPSGPTPTTAPTANGYRLVGLGDSLPGAGGVCFSPCASYVVQLGDAASAALGAPVAVTNLATNDSATSASVLSRVTSEKSVREALARADIITLTVGFNDWQSQCFWTGRDSCVANSQELVVANIALILKQVVKLRDGKPTAIRVTDYDNNTIGSAQSLKDWSVPAGSEAAFASFYAGALASFDSAICAAAVAGTAKCVDLVPAFNGPNADQDPGPLLGPDHLHLSNSGHELVAKLIADVGFDEL